MEGTHTPVTPHLKICPNDVVTELAFSLHSGARHLVLAGKLQGYLGWENRVRGRGFLNVVFKEVNNGTQPQHSLRDHEGDVLIDRGRLLRTLMPIYYSEDCLTCHGNPKGILDISGNPREGLRRESWQGPSVFRSPRTIGSSQPVPTEESDGVICYR